MMALPGLRHYAIPGSAIVWGKQARSRNVLTLKVQLL